MKVLEVSSLQEGIDQIIQRIESSFGQISAIQRAVRDFYQLDEALKGEGGKAIRHFYNECHQPFLIFLAQSLVDYQMALEKLKEAVNTFEPNHSGLIRETFLEQNVEDGLCHLKEKTEELTDEANRIIQSVEDIVSLQKIDDSEVMNNIQLGRKYAETTVEELHILDNYGVSLLKKTEENIQTMGTYLSELESKFQSGGLTIENDRVEAIQDIASHQTIMDSIYNRKPKKTEEINTKTIENMPLSEIEKAKEAILDDVSEDGKATISIAFQKLKDGELDRQEYVGILRGIQKFEVELNKLKKKEASIEKKDHFLISTLKTTGRTMKGAAIGVKDVAVDTVEGAYQMVRHPIQTGESVAQMIRNPKDTWEYMAGAIKESYNRDMVNGDAESRAHWVTYALGTIIGTKGAGSAAKTGTTVTKVAKEGAKKVANEAAKVKIPNLFPYGPQYQLAPGGNVPYNVVDGLRLRDQLVMFAREVTERATKGIGKGNKLKIEDFTKEILETKPMNSPIPEKWYKKGGSIFIENNGTWTYTNKSGTSVSYPNGFPDFTPFMHPNVKPVKIEVHSPKNNPKDFENANKAARLTKDTDPPIIDIRKPPDGYTWHHHEDGKTMMLVDEDIHREFRHIGGQSKVNGKNK
ncbi:putative ribonuclease toxin of YeeF-YezG toxin-antitoxin module [Oikeobacillus pervagus]|uniref:Ribonuclease toxin of YeeF-YezG toxin-antitoxin module n=1 Tax=Oikeobacillus pervagus TaxID=1325931 RepID=A0AAJ1WHT3_9BACI|nr:T7SS effector LXG polymorphic toxin [Oikeobacillus pervagus]MDQ0213945.1 putative ribonuclease toxin of YeeF-YezG toxin-antitoxin module [Oikeobacillus pervagus]